MNTAILYCRVSNRKQAETGHSLEAQEELLRTYANQKNFKIIATVVVPEGASGSRERLHFAQMMLRVNKENITHSLVEKIDRISRNFKEAIKLKESRRLACKPSMVYNEVMESTAKQTHHIKRGFSSEAVARRLERVNEHALNVALDEVEADEELLQTIHLMAEKSTPDDFLSLDEMKRDWDKRGINA